MEKNEKNTLGVCKIDGKNRITLPKKVLNLLNVSPGGLIALETNGLNETPPVEMYKAYQCIRRTPNHISQSDDCCEEKGNNTTKVVRRKDGSADHP